MHEKLAAKTVEDAFFDTLNILRQWTVERTEPHLLELFWEVCGSADSQWLDTTRQCTHKFYCVDHNIPRIVCDFSRLPESPLIGKVRSEESRENHMDCWVHRGCRYHADRLHPDSQLTLVSRCPNVKFLGLEQRIDDSIDEPVVSNCLKGMLTLSILPSFRSAIVH